MTYDLAIGDCAYSSWSLRGWLLLDAFGLPVRLHRARMYTPQFAALLGRFAPARLVPALRTPEGWVVPETAAIAETLAERHPEAGLWPDEPEARAAARWLAAEMHAGFAALRGACTMNLATTYEGFAPGADVRADLGRIERLWEGARSRFGSPASPWLFGRYTAADAFFAPVATRIATYGLPVGAAAQGYVAAHLAHPSFRRWRAMGVAEDFVQPGYPLDLPERPWPGPAPMAARAVAQGAAENAACPYSGRPVTDFLETGGRVFGFCNPFCRDKTVADPEAWPAFMALYEG